jgi:nitroimidazol reductase NimA-like FMN-containing flavoprotein (pyridoxamine 5'-phosphate oxidase superfamily)
MRRKEREVTNLKDIVDILTRCDTIRIGIQGEIHPYVVPVSFGVEVMDEVPVVYFHCAKQGLKIDLLEKHPEVCVEGDIFYKVEQTEQGITTRYESIVGQGRCEFLMELDEIKRCLRLINDHYGYNDYPLDRCRGLAHLRIGRIALQEITGKRNLA